MKEYRRPAGRVLIDEGINISTTYTADAGISAEFLEASLGFEVEGTSTFRIEWEATYSYAVKIRVYPFMKRLLAKFGTMTYGTMITLVTLPFTVL